MRSQRRFTSRFASVGLVVGLTVGATAGCSVVEGLAVAGNMNVIYLSAASTDVLLQKGYTIQVKPVCKLLDREIQSYSCSGKTADGKAITVSVANGKVSSEMVIKVGSSQVFKGSADEVIAVNAEASP